MASSARCMFRSVLALILALAPVLVSADTSTVEAAESAVRGAVRSKLGAQFRVGFDKPSERQLSVSEVVVSGTAYAHKGDSVESDRPFSYTVKVKRDGSSARDIRLAFADGTRYSTPDSWQKVDIGTDSVRITRPRWNERLDSTRVIFEGQSQRRVTITVFNKQNRKVADGAASPSDGKFRASMDLPRGEMRAVVTSREAAYSDEVRFRVLDDGQVEDPRAFFQIDEPVRDAELRNSRVTIAGSSSQSSVRVQVWDSRDNRVIDRNVPTRNNSWSTQIALNQGSYRFTAEDGRDRQSRNFRIVTDREPEIGSSPNLRLVEPARGETVRGPDVMFAGNSDALSVVIRVWDSGNRQVAEAATSTQLKVWRKVIRLGDGSYRFSVRDQKGRISESRSFRVRGGGVIDENPSVRFRVTGPSRNRSTPGPRITIAGSSPDRSVRIQLWDNSDRRLIDRKVSTQGGNWSTQVMLRDGRYRVRAEGENRNDNEEYWFEVK